MTGTPQIDVFRLDAVDDHPLPTPARLADETYVITDGHLHLGGASDLTSLAGTDGIVSWRLYGHLPDEQTPRMLFSDQEQYRRSSPTQLEYPAQGPRRAPSSRIELALDGLGLDLVTATVLSARAGDQHSFHFSRVAAADVPPPRSASFAPSHSVASARVLGRELPWLGRLLNRMLVPMLNWQAHRAARRRPHGH